VIAQRQVVLLFSLHEFTGLTRNQVPPPAGKPQENSRDTPRHADVNLQADTEQTLDYSISLFHFTVKWCAVIKQMPFPIHKIV
jgi:hypothetical protein